MSTRVFHRPARLRSDPLPREDLTVSAPPVLEHPSDAQDGAAARRATPGFMEGRNMHSIKKSATTQEAFIEFTPTCKCFLEEGR